MLMTETSFRPIDLYRMIGDPRNLGNANLTALAFLDGLWMRDQRGLILTGFLDFYEVCGWRARQRRSLLGVFGLALVVAITVAGYLHISLPYNLGAVQMYGYVYQGNPVWAFQNAATVLNRSQPPLPFVATHQLHHRRAHHRLLVARCAPAWSGSPCIRSATRSQAPGR